jgi:RND family efflux transporter MFP subunit
MNNAGSLDVKVWAVVAVLVGGLGCAAEKRQVSPPAEAVRDVSTVVVQRASVPDYVEAVGTVRAAETSQLASQMMGAIVNIAVHEGDHVRRGQVVATIDDTQSRAALDRASAAAAASQKEIAAAESDFRLADATLTRYQSLYERKSVSAQEFDEVRSRKTGAEARLEAARAGQSAAQAAVTGARAGFDYARIRAPFDGVVTAKFVEAGSLASPGMPIVTVENPSRFRLEATVDESAMGIVHLGETVDVTLDALGDRVISGKVAQIVPAADPASRSFTVKIEMPSIAEMRSGLFGRARFTRGHREMIVVPAASVMQRGQLQGVYVVGTDQIANLRFVTLGKQSGQGYEVLAGLEPGELLVQNASGRDLAGRKIEAR